MKRGRRYNKLNCERKYNKFLKNRKRRRRRRLRLGNPVKQPAIKVDLRNLV